MEIKKVEPLPPSSLHRGCLTVRIRNEDDPGWLLKADPTSVPMEVVEVEQCPVVIYDDGRGIRFQMAVSKTGTVYIGRIHNTAEQYAQSMDRALYHAHKRISELTEIGNTFILAKSAKWRTKARKLWRSKCSEPV